MIRRRGFLLGLLAAPLVARSGVLDIPRVKLIKPAPVISGTVVTDGLTWDAASVASITRTFVWYRDGVPIEGAFGEEYALNVYDVGHDISVSVRYGFEEVAA